MSWIKIQTRRVNRDRDEVYKTQSPIVDVITLIIQMGDYIPGGPRMHTLVAAAILIVSFFAALTIWPMVSGCHQIPSHYLNWPNIELVCDTNEAIDADKESKPQPAVTEPQGETL